MEVFLLWMDDLDDAVVAAWTLLPRLAGFVAALCALAATAFAFVSFPALALPSVLLLLASLSLQGRKAPATLPRA